MSEEKISILHALYQSETEFWTGPSRADIFRDLLSYLELDDFGADHSPRLGERGFMCPGQPHGSMPRDQLMGAMIDMAFYLLDACGYSVESRRKSGDLFRDRIMLKLQSSTLKRFSSSSIISQLGKRVLHGCRMREDRQR